MWVMVIETDGRAECRKLLGPAAALKLVLALIGVVENGEAVNGVEATTFFPLVPADVAALPFPFRLALPFLAALGRVLTFLATFLVVGMKSSSSESLTSFASVARS